MNLEFKTTADVHSASDTSSYIDECGLIRGADVEAHRIAALVGGGMSVDQVIEDYPNLAAPQIEAAVRFARANPAIARHFPPRTVKSVLRDGGGGGLAGAFAAASENEGDE